MVAVASADVGRGWNMHSQEIEKVAGGKGQSTHNVGNRPRLPCYPTKSESVLRLGHREVRPQTQGDRQLGKQSQ
jgi:hypothetical protein